MNIIFMGTPDFAVPSLKSINEKYGVKAVFTKVDKVNQRGNKVRFSAVKTYALENEIDVYQPKSVKVEETIKLIKEINPDLIIVVAYGKILPKELIDIPKHGVINLHSSLLPKYRGAAPIHNAIINGDDKSGISIMYIDEELDSGDVILQKETLIKEEDNLESLHDRLAEIGREGLLEAVELMEKGLVSASPQDHSKATFVKPIKKEECEIVWSKTKEEIYNFVRGLNPFPTAFSILNEKRYKIYEVEKCEGDLEGQNGEIISLVKGSGPLIKVSNGGLILKKVKPENKRAISGTDLVNGNYLKVGEVFRIKD